MQIIVILKKNINTTLSYVRSVTILNFSEYFQLIFDNSNVNNDKQIKRKMANFFLKTFQKYQIFLPYPSEESHFRIKSCFY